ncbi:SusC/RagA family TonB-linked outer membrane protein [Mucilaginibacter sp. OK098]|uniref:SusC/RagA family TonB-linked outer membrane protein n=1 Tax=Mucilaginibacter sp. OK098 TaxID=1855297 RepID=UPI0009188796|nr:TonB-dependent receptor [Mucilaginibacter sp. OK098]SHN37555.1 TonB-linked outer membrane protein, SusC/RagA family [Mucilaginibacter sp. OK098]
MFKSLLLKGSTLCVLLCCIVSSLVVTAQTKHSGKVIGGDDKQPVVGASLRIKGTNTGAVTDVNGEFTLSLSPGNVLVVSYLTYQTKEVTVQGDQYLTIVLTPATTALNEVVVTGYTTQRKKDITGAVASVSITDAKKIPVTSSEQLLQGQASGVTVINQGAPGSSSTVFVRGITNFGNTTPLYVVDGVQIGDMSRVNPNDIESISVLKDAGAAAIYGVSGGNGVIVVTTKKGKAGKTTFSYDAYYGDQVPLQGNVWHLMTPAQQAQLSKESGDSGQKSLYDPNNTGNWTVPAYGYHGTAAPAGTSFGTAGVTNDPAIVSHYIFDAVKPGNDFLVQKFNQAGTDWFHEIFKHAPQQSHSVTASGGSDKNTFLFSLQYLNQQGTLIKTFEKRYQARVNSTFSLLDNHFRFGEQGYVFYRENNGGSPFNQQKEGGSISHTYREMPIIPVHDVGGNYGGGYDGPGGEPLGNGSNPVAIQERSRNDRNKSWNMQGTIFAEADFLKYFTARTAFSGNANNTFYYFTAYNPYNDYESHANPNAYAEVSNYSYTYNYTNSINYKQVIGKHNISVFAGYEIKQNGGQQLGIAATTFVTLDPNFLTVAGTTLPASLNLAGGNGTFLYQPTGTESLFTRLDYSYNDRYLLGATVRRDGYSSFFPGRQWGTFPSVSLGWRISQEDFMKGVSWINDLKLRGSYGTTGSNANITGSNAVNTYNYGFGSTAYGIDGSLSNTTTGYALTGIGNPKTTWETDKIINVGIDVSLFNHLDLNVEYYKKSISGLLFPLALPATTGGATAPTVNVGDVQNKGFDIAATYHDAIGSDFKFSIGAYITAYKNKITKLSSTDFFDIFSGSRVGSFVREQVGQPIGEFYGYKVKGIYQNASQLASLPGYSGATVGSYIYQDVNGDGKVNADDRTFIGNPNPNFNYGINLNASYKRFDVSMVLYGEQGNKDFNYVKYWTDTYHSFPGGKDLDLLTKSAIVDAATNTVTNPGATQQALSVANTIPSTFYVENGSFLKCRVAQLGYTFNPGLLKSVGVTQLHIYVQGTNLFTITKYSGLDPELVPSISNISGNRASASTGVDWGAYPNNQRTYLVGVNMTF